MISNNTGENPTGASGYTDILGGFDKAAKTYVLSAHFLCPFEDKIITNPKWWQFWKPVKTNYLTGERWIRKSCMLYQWQVSAIFKSNYSVDSNESIQALLFVLGGCNSGVHGVKLEAIGANSSHTPMG